MITHLELRFLGPFSVILDGKPITTFESVKVRALLAYLAAEAPRLHPRERLAGLLWPDWPQKSAMSNLRYALADLRKNIGDQKAQPPFLLITREAIQFNQESNVRLDVEEFEYTTITNQNSPERSSSATRNHLDKDSGESTIALYRGEFLEGFSLNDSPAFEEWILAKRAYFKRLALKRLHNLVEAGMQCCDYEQALDYAHRQLELESCHEEAHQEIMYLLAVLGRRSEALIQYETCRRVLKNELGVDPGIQTIQLHEQILNDKIDLLIKIPASTRITQPAAHLPDFLAEDNVLDLPPVFVARKPELRKLDIFLQEMLKGSTKVVFVTGDAGQGKTALIHEFARNAMAAHPTLLVASGTCNAYSGLGDPFLPFRDVMAMLSGDVETRWAAGSINREHALRLWQAHSLTVQAVLANGSSLVDTILSRDALRLSARTSVPDGLDLLERLDTLIKQRQLDSIEQEQRLLFEQYTNVLRILANQHPLILLLDDMQWADNASINLLFHLGRRLNDSNILIICAYRPDEIALGRIGERHPLNKVLSELKRSFGNVWVDLSQLKQSENHKFVDDLLDAEPNRLGESFRNVLFQRTEGHPLFTIELLRAMQARGNLFKDDAGFWCESPLLDWDQLPARVEAVIEERIDQLDQETLQIITVASVEGEIFTVQVLLDVQQTSERLLLGQLSELEQRHRLVKEQEDVQTCGVRLVRYKFNHVLFRDFLYNRISRGERQLLHGEVAASLEKRFAMQLDEMVAQIAYHYYQANAENHAFKYFILAAERANHLFATEEAIKHYSQAIELVSQVSPDKVVITNLYRDRGLAYERLGKFDLSRTDHETALQVARSIRENILEWRALLDLGKLWGSHNYDQSRDYFEQGLKLAHQINNPTILASSLNWIGNWYINAEYPENAIDFHLKALAIFEETGDKHGIANTLDLLGIDSVIRGNYVSGLAYYNRAITLFRELNDRPSLASSLIGRGNIGGVGYISHSIAPATKTKDALDDFEEAIRITQEIGSPTNEAWALWSSGIMYIVKGDFGRSLEAVQTGLRIAADMGHREWIVGNRYALGVLYVELFSLEDAQSQLDQAFALAKELRSQHWINVVTGILATIYHMLNQFPQAQACLETVLSSQTPMDTMNRRYFWIRRAELALAQGDPLLTLEIADRLITSAPEISPGGVITFLWKLKSEALASIGRIDEAISLLHTAIENARETGEKYLLWRLHAILGRLYHTLNDQETAQSEFSTAGGLIEELAATIPVESLKNNFLQGAFRILTR